MLTTHPLTEEGIARCLANLRPADRAEIRAAGASTEAISRAALEGWGEEAKWNGRTVFAYGVRSLGDTGVPWMLSTDVLAEADRSAVARLARRVVARMRQGHPRLANLIHASNTDAMRFVRWLGFTILPGPHGPSGGFRMFVWSRDV